LDPHALTQFVDLPPSRLPAVHERLARALELLHEAGWTSGPDGMLHDAAGGPCEFEYLTDDPTSVTEAAWQHNLARIGVRMRIRRSDFALVLERLNNFEFDVFLMNPGNFLLPLPVDLESLYGSASADKKGSVNIGGVKDPVLDRLIGAIRAARNEPELRDATRAFDREFRSRHYSVATGLSLFDNFAHWNTIALPAKRPVFYAIEEPGFHPLLWPVMTSWARSPATVQPAPR
jgi:microcin C transport system substrate-binding protein